MNEDLKQFLKKAGLKKSCHTLIHSSFRNIRNAFPDISIEYFIRSLQEIVTDEGSVIMPAFTYCFKRSSGEFEVFDRLSSPSKVGAVSEVFRNMPNVIRTSSPTHSFSLWGKAAKIIGCDNSPASPLGAGSILDWLANTPSSYIILAGVNFSALSFGHYLEAKAPVPWHNISPWDYLSVEPIGASASGEQKLIELPGCAKPFINFERFLIDNEIISFYYKHNTKFFFISTETLIKHGLSYFSKQYKTLLCDAGTCQACDSRRKQTNIY